MRNSGEFYIFAFMLNIIHLSHRKDRERLLIEQLKDQNIVDYKLWEGVFDKENPKCGIARAHKNIVRWAQSQNHPFVLIAEDDIKFTAIGAFEYFIKNEPKEYDLYLGGVMHGEINEDHSINDFSGLTLYKIRENFYDTFLSLSEERDIDRELANKGKFIVCNPFTVVQHNGFSDNKNEYQNFDLYLQQHKLFGQ